MLPIPPGACRGLWVTPAFTVADVGKTVTISGDVVTVDGNSRTVNWEGDTPEDVKDVKIVSVGTWRDHRYVYLEGGVCFKNSRRSGGSDSFMEVDLAFAMVDCRNDPHDNSQFNARFFLPVAAYTDGSLVESSGTMLSDARDVRFGELVFSRFSGSTRA